MIYKDKEPDPVNDTSEGIGDSTFWRMENVLILLAILNAFEQEEKVVGYDKNSPHWEEIADYYRLTMRIIQVGKLMRKHLWYSYTSITPMIPIKDICNLT